MSAININFVMLTYYWIQFIDVPLYFWYAVICREISSSKVFDPKGPSPSTTLPYMRHINTQYSVLSTVVQLVEAPQYKPVGRGFHSRW
jgi:hypothetical protein